MRVTLSRALYAIAKAVSKESHRGELQHVLVENLDEEGHGVAVATDGKVLLRSFAAVSHTKGYDPQSRLLSVDSLDRFKKAMGVKPLHKALRDSLDPVVVEITDKLTAFQRGVTPFTLMIDTSKLKDHRYPDWRNVWPDKDKDKCVKFELAIDVLQTLIDARKAMSFASTDTIQFYIPPESEQGYVVKGILIRMVCPEGSIEGIIMPSRPGETLEPPKREPSSE